MTIILIIYLLISIYGITFQKDNNEYLSKETTVGIEGIFTIMILMSHFKDYASISSDSIYFRFIAFFGQLMVTMFLFYSGYGIMESLKNKKNYIKNFFSNRFLKTFIHFDLAVILYVFVALILHNKYSLATYLLSFTGWTSIGNSNWFMFVILGLYLITYISNMIFSKKRFMGLIMTTFLSGMLIIFLYFFKEDWWYNIILCYPCGMWYSYFKDYIEKFILTKYKYISLCLLIIVFIVLDRICNNLIIYEVVACIFCLLVVNITYIFRFGNKILLFLGKYAFQIYILQRIAYSLLVKIISNEIIFFVVALGCTIILAMLFKCMTDLVDKKLFKKVA